MNVESWKGAMMRYLDNLPNEDTVLANAMAAAHMLWVLAERKEPSATLMALRVTVDDAGVVQINAEFSSEVRADIQIH